MSAEKEFEKLVKQLGASHAGDAGQMFGKRCIKVGGKAAVALFKDFVVFKLPTEEHSTAMKLDETCLWDPSGKGRAMKEWVQIGHTHKKYFKKFALAAAEYVG